MNMDLNREETMEFLGDMGVELPPNNKLPLEALEQRLTRAIDLVQPSLKKKIDPSKLKKWAAVAKGRRLTDMMITYSWKEATAIANDGGASAATNAFMDLRNVVATIGSNLDDESKLAVVEDKAGAYGFTMRVVDVYALTDDIPIFIVLYEHGQGNIFTRHSAANFLTEPCPGMKPGQDAIQIKTIFSTQKFLLKILEMNATHIDPSYAPSYLRPSEVNYKLSFLVPISPLTMREIGGLSSDVGCAICGNPVVSRCAGCQGVSYCGKECQKADWPSHKRACKSKLLGDGTWMEVEMSTSGYPGMFVSSINAFSAVKGLGNDKLKKNTEEKIRSEADGPQPNIHGDATFILKIQVPAPSPLRPPIMIYDRRRSVDFFVRRDIELQAYERLERVARQSGYLGQKIYRYAKRTGDKKISICLDREPPAEAIKW